MNLELVKEYSVIKQQIKDLEEKENELSEKIMVDMAESNVDKYSCEFGTCSKSVRTSYKYTDAVKVIEDEAKALKKEQADNGMAEKIETTYLRFQA